LEIVEMKKYFSSDKVDYTYNKWRRSSITCGESKRGAAPGFGADGYDVHFSWSSIFCLSHHLLT